MYNVLTLVRFGSQMPVVAIILLSSLTLVLLTLLAVLGMADLLRLSARLETINQRNYRKPTLKKSGSVEG